MALLQAVVKGHANRTEETDIFAVGANVVLVTVCVVHDTSQGVEVAISVGPLHGPDRLDAT